MDWTGLSAYAAGGAVGGAVGWLTSRRSRRWRFEVRAASVLAGMLLAGALIVPRLRDGAVRAELRSAGLDLFGDPPAAEHYVRRLLPIREDAGLADKLQVISARLPAGVPPGSGLAGVGYAGMARLSLPELEVSLAVRRRLADGSPAVCAALWKGGIAASDLTAGLRRLSLEDKQRWIDLTARATTLELAAEGPPPPISNARAALAWSILLARLPDAKRAIIERAAKSGSATSSDDACQAFKIVGSEAAALAPEARETLLRVVTSPFLVSG